MPRAGPTSRPGASSGTRRTRCSVFSRARASSVCEPDSPPRRKPPPARFSLTSPSPPPDKAVDLLSMFSPVLALSFRRVLAFSDLLLHDMGALGDGIEQGDAK